MRYEKGHKERTHDRIIQIASEKFRKNGIMPVGISSLMADAGLTHGGFYAHFKSKDALLDETLGAALEQMTDRFEHVSQGRTDALEEILDAYLCMEHRDTPELGCPVAALTAEIARHAASTRQIFSSKLEKLLGVIESQLYADSEAVRSGNAVAIFSLMVGALQLARAEIDETRAEKILQAAIKAASALGQRNE
jgi:AcrR family transcriptional regulator